MAYSFPVTGAIAAITLKIINDARIKVGEFIFQYAIYLNMYLGRQFTQTCYGC